jgi:hypothetical protein
MTHDLKSQWVEASWHQAKRIAHLYSGARKIIRNVTLEFTLDDSLTLADAGYTKSKLTMLTKNYLHKESQAVAIQLWRKRCGQEKYGSVSFTTFNHFVKGGSIDAKRSKRASVFCPCIQSVVLTWVTKQRVGVDVFYRTTEIFKKFAPDLVFIRDVLLAPFDLSHAKSIVVTCHFANVTIHPMYAATLFPHMSDPVARLRELKRHDEFFHNWVVKWTARYLCKEHFRGIAKFSQALRVQKDAMTRLNPAALRRLQKYLRDNHPGFRNDYVDPDDN